MPVQSQSPMTYEEFVDTYQEQYLYRFEKDFGEWIAEAIFPIMRADPQKIAEDLFDEMYEGLFIEFISYIEYDEHADLMREYIHKENLQIREHVLRMIPSMLKMASRCDAWMALNG